MSTLKELFTDLKDRISNPSILSFVISWLILNYKIPIGLIFYKISDLDKYHNATYFSLISDETNIWHLLWIPLIVSAFYTLIFPFVKAGIRIFNSWLITKTDGEVFHYTVYSGEIDHLFPWQIDRRICWRSKLKIVAVKAD